MSAAKITKLHLTLRCMVVYFSILNLVQNCFMLLINSTFIISSQVEEETKEAAPMPMDLEFYYCPEPKEEEATPALAEEVWPCIPEGQSSTNIVTGVLGALRPQEEMAEPDPGYVEKDPMSSPLSLLRRIKTSQTKIWSRRMCK